MQFVSVDGSTLVGAAVDVETPTNVLAFATSVASEIPKRHTQKNPPRLELLPISTAVCDIRTPAKLPAGAALTNPARHCLV
jgi:hypothetical protein